jgi:hypothetical protein
MRLRLTSTLFILVVWNLTVRAHAGEANAPTEAAIRAEYAAIVALRQAKPPATVASDEVSKIAWLRNRNIEFYDRGLAFYTRNTTHPLRWDVLVLLPSGWDFREKVFRSGFRQLLPEPVSRAAWEAEYYPRLRALLAAPDSSPAAQREARAQLIDYTSRLGLGQPQETESCLALIRDWLADLERTIPPDVFLPRPFHSYCDLLEFADPLRCFAYLRELETRHQDNTHRDRALRELAQGRRRALEAQALPLDELWQRLHELDPVLGDPRRYHGKVVLLALGPVTYESLTENLEDLYAQYHAAGLEIMQVAPFNNAYGLPPEPQQRRDMEKIVALRRWPWAVLWNPRGHLSDIAGKWGYNSVPAWMLIGRDGRLVVDRNSPRAIIIPRELALPAPATR